MPKEVRGTTNDDFTLNIDLAPTLLSAAGVPVPKFMQGRDIAQLYLNNGTASKPWRNEFFYEVSGYRSLLLLHDRAAAFVFCLADCYSRYSQQSFRYYRTPVDTRISRRRDRSRRGGVDSVCVRSHPQRLQVLLLARG